MEIESEPLERGPQWLQDAFNDLRYDVIANRVIKGAGTTVTETPNGTAVNAAATVGGA